MIRGIGVDSVDIARFERQLERTPTLRTRLFVGDELQLPLRSLAARFAAKEALIKALGGSGTLSWHDLEVRCDALGAPSFMVGAGLRQALAARGASRVHVSMTHDGGIATAFVVVEAGKPAENDAQANGAAPPRSDTAGSLEASQSGQAAAGEGTE